MYGELASLVAQLQVLFTIGFAAFWFRERPLTMLGASVVFIGHAINVFGAKLFPSGKTAIKAQL
jgi:drug/metabolite transporter (DMT)-like permease